MILRKIEFTNIRSYRKAAIEFPPGKTLFEGDIGSGKSTILMAIEFAFFGLGSETGGSLLRVGQDEGTVALEFEVDGSKYAVVRGLARKGSKVQQTVGKVITPAGEAELSPSELKEKVLDILKFNEAPNPKAQSRVYRYAVYTPQEDMKSILVMAPGDRMQILRRAFGIEEYSTAAANASSLARELRARARELKSAAGEAPELKRKEEEVARELALLEEVSASLEGREGEAAAVLESLKEELKGLRGDRERLAALREAAAAAEKRAAALAKQAGEAQEEARRAGGRAEKAQAALSRPAPRAQGKGRAELEEEVRSLEERSKKLSILRDRADQKTEEYRQILKDGKCPVCDRPAEAHEFVGKERAKAAEKEHLIAEGQECEALLVRARRLLEERASYDAAEEKRALQAEALEEARGAVERAASRGEALARDQAEAEAQAAAARKEIAGLGEASRRLELLEGRVAGAEKGLKDIQLEGAKTRTRIEELGLRLAEVRERAAAARAAEKSAHRLSEGELWLEGYFGPTVAAIEGQVMARLNQEFDSDFKRWFAMLVDDPQKEVRVDEDFTPLVSQGGYDQDSDYLSGGERTSVALAYRLALNTLVQRTAVGMRSNILILDEPTDGFSREQLGSVREMLDEVGAPQMIIVSHEKELESFADQIFRVSKERGESRVDASPRG